MVQGYLVGHPNVVGLRGFLEGFDAAPVFNYIFSGGYLYITVSRCVENSQCSPTETFWWR